MVDGVVAVAGAYEVELEVTDGRGGRDSTRLMLQLPQSADAGVPDAGLAGFDVLDPGEVYVFGALEEGSLNSRAIAHWSTPDTAAYGFPRSAGNRLAMSPDGHVIYLDETMRRFRTFVCDKCPYEPPRPVDVSANDGVLESPCANPIALRMGPDGEVWTTCDSIHWLAPPELSNVYSVVGLVAVGRGVVLTATRVIQFAPPESELHNLTDRIVAARWKGPSSFYVATLDVMNVATLWDVALGGATRLGTFPAIPGNSPSYELDKYGRLFTIDWNLMSETVVRRSISGESSIVYSDAYAPLVKLGFTSTLVTGP